MGAAGGGHVSCLKLLIGAGANVNTVQRLCQGAWGEGGGGTQRERRRGTCTLHTLHTLHPTPYILYHVPYTQHPTPYVLHPTPHTLPLNQARTPNPNQVNQSGRTALMGAAFGGFTAAVRLLVDSGADPDKRDKVRPRTPNPVEFRGFAQSLTPTCLSLSPFPSIP